MDDTALVDHRRARDRFFAESPRSPLPLARRDDFTHLDYYEPNPELALTVRLEPADGEEVRVQTSDGADRTYRRVGRVSFEVEGEPVSLTLYATGHPGLFVPFRDATSGTETYGAGRYLDIEPNEDGTVTIDFNYAYNPFCAYDDGYSCPLPPVENWLRVPIRAGEKLFGPG